MMKIITILNSKGCKRLWQVEKLVYIKLCNISDSLDMKWRWFWLSVKYGFFSDQEEEEKSCISNNFVIECRVDLQMLALPFKRPTNSIKRMQKKQMKTA